MHCIKSMKLARSKFLGCQLGTNSYIFTCQNTGPIASSESLHRSIPLASLPFPRLAWYVRAPWTHQASSARCSRSSPNRTGKNISKHVGEKKPLKVHNWNVIKNMVKCESMHRICAETLWKLWGPKCIKMPAVRFDHDSDAWLPERQPLRKPLRWKKAMLSTTGG